ncbi:MAG: hypothetical protein Q4F66_01060 [Clostridium sp.]|nr:hypothetical protein [Clostridium sp.]
MINRKISRIIGPVAGMMTILIAMGAISMPVYAEDKEQVEYSYNQSVFNKDNLNREKVIEENGCRLTVKNIAATRNKIKVSMEFESSRDGEDLIGHNNLDLRVSMNNIKHTGGSGSRSFEGNGKVIIEEELRNDDGYPEKGILRIDVVDGQLDFNKSLKIPVDFTEDFSQSFSKDINSKINGTDINLDKFESNALETSVVVSKQLDNSMHFHKYSYSEFLNFIVDIDGEIYYTDYPSYSDDRDGREYDHYTVEGLTYEKVKNAENISIIQIENNMSEEEIEEFYNSRDDEINDTFHDDEQSISYPEKIKFVDGSEGDVNISRDGDVLKVFCSSDSDLKSMLMSINIEGAYIDEEKYYSHLDGKHIYKDLTKKNQYIVEFNDSEKDKMINLNYNPIIYNSDKFS